MGACNGKSAPADPTAAQPPAPAATLLGQKANIEKLQSAEKPPADGDAPPTTVEVLADAPEEAAQLHSPAKCTVDAAESPSNVETEPKVQLSQSPRVEPAPGADCTEAAVTASASPTQANASGEVQEKGKEQREAEEESLPDCREESRAHASPTHPQEADGSTPAACPPAQSPIEDEEEVSPAHAQTRGAAEVPSSPADRALGSPASPAVRSEAVQHEEVPASTDEVLLEENATTAVEAEDAEGAAAAAATQGTEPCEVQESRDAAVPEVPPPVREEATVRRSKQGGCC